MAGSPYNFPTKFNTMYTSTSLGTSDCEGRSFYIQVDMALMAWLVHAPRYLWHCHTDSGTDSNTLHTQASTQLTALICM